MVVPNVPNWQKRLIRNGLKKTKVHFPS